MSEKVVNKVFEIFQEESLSMKQALTVIANVFIQMGMGGIESPPITSMQHLIEVISEEKKKNGESIYTACVQQGATIFVWLDSLEEESDG